MDIFYPSRVVVRFREAGTGAQSCLQQQLAASPGATAARLFSSVDAETIQAWTTRAMQTDRTYVPPDFNTYFGINCTSHNQALELSDRLSADPLVRLAYTENGIDDMPPSEAIPSIRHDSGLQPYCSPAPVGIDAFHAWSLSGGRGEAGIRYIDIEQGWMSYHEAVIPNRLACTGLSHPEAEAHGTAVLGVLGMQPPDDDPRSPAAGGIVPHADGYVLSQWRPAGDHNTADAIMAAIGYLHYGDVLLIEAQARHRSTGAQTWPIEIQDACYEAIRLATALGIIVIEPAANGGADLDRYAADGENIFLPARKAFRDSGAIMVAAAAATLPHIRMPFSNYGRRIDCYAWGQRVFTAGSHPRSAGIVINTYTHAFGGTSAAAAIIAGAAIALQSITVAAGRPRLGPQSMRSLLSDKSLGTPSAAAGKDKIGVMPDLRRLAPQ
ncbi:MAG: S8 family serine peptidase [Bacteroidetes bacterium]|nr:S8 family serine peptidase [Bacteroidota bacterium]